MFKILLDMDGEVDCNVLAIIPFAPYADTVNGMFENVFDSEVEVLEAPGGGFNDAEEVVIKEGADIAMDLSSSKSANSSR